MPQYASPSSRIGECQVSHGFTVGKVWLDYHLIQWRHPRKSFQILYTPLAVFEFQPGGRMLPGDVSTLRESFASLLALYSEVCIAMVLSIVVLLESGAEPSLSACCHSWFKIMRTWSDFMALVQLAYVQIYVERESAQRKDQSRSLHQACSKSTIVLDKRVTHSLEKRFSCFVQLPRVAVVLRAQKYDSSPLTAMPCLFLTDLAYA